MNWSDWLVIAIIAGFGLLGLKNGFIYSIFRIASFFISVLISLKFYPVVSKMLMKTALYASMKASILKNLLLQQQAQAPKVDSQVKQSAADAVINNLHLPGFLKDTLVHNMPNVSGLVDVTKIMDTVSGELAKLAVDIISLVLLYIGIRIGLVFLRVILQGIAQLPLFKQVDKLGGFALGAVEGLLTVYIVFAVLMMFNAAPQFKGLFTALDSSMFAKFFYQNNFIVNWMFPSNKIL